MDVKALRAHTLVGLAAGLPLLELYFARTVYRWRTDLYADSGFMIGLGMAFFALCVLFRGIGELRLSRPILLANLLLMVASIYASIPIAPHGVILHTEWVGALWMLLVGSGLCIFASPRRVIEHFYMQRPVFYFLGVVYVAEVLYYMMRYVKWFKQDIWYGIFAGKLTSAVRYLLEVMQYEILHTRFAYTIEHPYLTIRIYTPCSGMEGVVFFCAVFAAMMMLDYKSIPMKKIVLGFVLGILMMFTLNIVRITVFFMFGVWATQNWGNEMGTQAVVDLFHNNIGWLMYSLGMVGFFMWFYRNADKKVPNPGNAG